MNGGLMPSVIRRFQIGLFQGLCGGLLIAGMSVNATPDLIVNQFRLEGNVAVQTRTFTSNDCSVVEGCASAGTRRLLLFDVGIANAGDGDLIIGDPAQRPDLFHLSPCHGHYHMDGVAAYELLNTNGQVVITVRKQGFCFRDDARAFTNGPVEGKYTCDYQGLSIGWEDVYDKSLDCQWLDITGIPSGQYILRVVANPDAILHESNLQNNVAQVLIDLPSTTTPPTNKPPKCVNHDDWKKWWDWKKLIHKWKGHWVKKCKIPRCTCHCHKPPGKPPGNGHGNGNGNGHDGDDDDDAGGGNGGKDDDDDHGGGNGGGKGGDDDDDAGGGNGGGRDDDDDHDGGNGGGKDDDDGGKGKGNGNGHGKGKDDGKGKGNGHGKGKVDNKGKGKPQPKPQPKPKAKK